MYYSIGPGLGPASLRDDEFRPVFWSEVFRRVLVSDAYFMTTRTRGCEGARASWIYLWRMWSFVSVYPGKSIEKFPCRLSDDEPRDG